MLEKQEPGKLYGLDHLRALAIAMVFLFHYQLPFFGHPEWVQNVAKFGWTGVDLFFVLSGYLIASQLFTPIKNGQRPSLKVFFVKRTFRILPAFGVTVALYFCFPSFHEREALPDFWKFITFTQNFGLDIKTYGTFSHAWSLCVEEHFYLLFPLVLVALLSFNLLNLGSWILVLLFTAGFLIRYYNWNLYFSIIGEENSWSYWYKYVYYPSYNRLDGLLIGVGIAGIHQFFPHTFQNILRLGNWLIMFGLLVLIGAYLLCYEERSLGASVFGFPLVAIGFGFFVAAAISPGSFLHRWNSKATSFLATLSFSLYLTHKGVIHITQGILLSQGLDIDSDLTLLISLLACILAALVLNLLVEKPFLNLRRKILLTIKNKNE